ncbi:MAG: hypothetical protein BWZ10_01076 [candidate division BRC1 bacterium ADurb.BinA364]|nr:MAG: hypothetical protein BWZ10_01076 [candidate division BRC1 bacterium ADurb.BinA364]
MIVMEKTRVVWLFGLLAAFLAPFPALAFPSMAADAALLPAIFLLELVLFGLFLYIANPRAGFQGAGAVALMLALVRGALNFLGALLLVLSPFGPEAGAGGESWSAGSAFLQLHFGNPLAMLGQIFLLLIFAPYLLYPFLPGALSAEAMKAIGMASARRGGAGSKAESEAQAMPLGGFMQIFSYEELTRALDRIVGLEGFMLYSDEELNLWSHFGVDLDVEAAAVSSNRALLQTEAWTEGIGLSAPQKILVETNEHFLFNLPIGAHSRLLLFFTADAPAADTLQKIEMIQRTVLEFLRSRGQEE